jgi:Tfp pilus assembly protein PilX
VLGIAMLVTLIGLSGVLATRIERRNAALSLAASQADIAAQCFMDVVLFRLTHDLYWRVNYINDAWSAPETCGEVAASFKLVDEADGDLANDEDQPARLYCQATVGEGMRMYSVLFREKPPVTNSFLLNGGMESGTSNWYGYNCSISAVTGPRHSGSAALNVTSRTDNYSGPMQTIAASLEDNYTYEIEAWARTDSGESVIRFVVYYYGSFSGWRTITAGDTVVKGSWTRLSASVTPNWSGSLGDAYLIIGSESGTAPFHVDDVIMRKAGTGQDAELLPVPGAFRREVLP